MENLSRQPVLFEYIRRVEILSFFVYIIPMEYNKIVRDRIPEIIIKSGKDCRYTQDSDTNYSLVPALERKLDEELKEYKDANYLDDAIEELGDIIDVCYAIAKHKGYSEEELDVKREKKYNEKGGFDKLIFLYEAGS